MAIKIATGTFGPSPCSAVGLISKYPPRCTDIVQYCYAVNKNGQIRFYETELSVSFKTYIELFHVKVF